MDPPAKPPETGEERCKRRALELARAQATDEEVAAALRDELATTDPPILARDKITRVLRALTLKVGKAKASKLDDARTAGRLAPLVSLLQAAQDPQARDRTAAAQALARRDEKDAGGELKRMLVQLAGMSPAERAAYASEVTARMGEG